MTPLRVLSLGAGVQSSALLLMSIAGELPLDAAVFADTGWEPRSVYDWLHGTLVPAAAAGGVDLRIVRRSDGATARTAPHEMPLFISTDGKPGIIRRQCTNRFKIQVVRQELRGLLGAGPRDRLPAGAIAQVFGISADEAIRMRDSDVGYVVNEYPLVDRGISRVDCLAWLERHGYYNVPKSACIGCPFRSDREWARMRDEHPDEFADACDLDDSLRDGRAADRRGTEALRGVPYLHRRRIPLRDVEFQTGIADGQGDLFGEECAGVCGV